MHFHMTVPSPLARLTRILVALERGREGVRREHAHGPAATGPFDWIEQDTRPSDVGGLESLSLIRCEPSHGRPGDDLARMSFDGDDKWDSQGDADTLGHISLSSDHRPHPGR